MVLGNHDLHLLMVAEGCAKLHRNDTLHDILDAPDRDELLHWLRHQKLLHVDGNYVMVHAGLLPSWSVAQAALLAKIVELRFAVKISTNLPPYVWESARPLGRRLGRLCASESGNQRHDTHACMHCRTEKWISAYKGLMQDIPAGYLPWFDMPNRASREATVVCGHWSALGLQIKDNLIALDTGCLWGGSLTAFALKIDGFFRCLVRQGKG